MKHQYGTKSTFVRLNPTLSAKDLVRLAKTQGIKLSAAQVYNIRATSKRRGITPEHAAEWGARFEAAAIHEPVNATPVRDPNAADTKLRQLILEIGLGRAREVLAEVGRRFQ